MSSSSKVFFPGVDGQQLVARLHLPVGTPRAFALFAHCFSCSQESLAAPQVSAALASEGIAVLCFDFTGLGENEGDFAGTDFSSSVEHVLYAADWLREHYAAPRLLIGHSLGGAAVLAAAGGIGEAAAVVTINAPSDPSAVERLLASSGDEVDGSGAAEVELMGRHFQVNRQFLEDIGADKMRDAVATLNKALLAFHCPADDVVSVDNGERIFAAARHPKSFVSLDGADHLLSRREDAAYLAAALAAWVERYVERDPEPKSVEHVTRAVVEQSSRGKFANDVFMGRHRFTADEPVDLGGGDTGPSPYEYLLAGLGACTSMTMRMYADRKGWPLEGVRVELEHEKRHAEDCAECETKKGRIDHITRRIAIAGPLDDEQRQRLIEIANKCPVHRTLHEEVYVDTLAATDRDLVDPG